MSKFNNKHGLNSYSQAATKEIQDAYKQIKALELKSKHTVKRDFRNLHNQVSPDGSPKGKYDRKIKVQMVDDEEEEEGDVESNENNSVHASNQV